MAFSKFTYVENSENKTDFINFNYTDIYDSNSVVGHLLISLLCYKVDFRFFLI